MSKISLNDKLKSLEQEHQDIDVVLTQLQEKQTIDFLQIKRLKKRKLLLNGTRF